MSFTLIERHDHCPECKFSKLRLHACRTCLVVIFSTVFDKAARCPVCNQWLKLEREIRVKEMPGFAEWYSIDRRPDFDFVCAKFTTYKNNTLRRLAERDQLTLKGFERS